MTELFADLEFKPAKSSSITAGGENVETEHVPSQEQLKISFD